MKFVIKSKNRVEKFKTHSYKLLKSYDIKDEDIYIFVSNADDHINYLAEYPFCNVILGDKGICGIDNFIVRFFDEGEKYIYLNDDLKKLFKLSDKKKVELDKEEFEELITILFENMELYNSTYGGVFPCDNSLFMFKQKNIIFTDFRMIIDMFSACINNKNIVLTYFEELGDNFMNDMEKSILHYKDRGSLIRLNHYCYTADSFGDGIENRNRESMWRNAELLLEKYPDYIASIKPKNNGWCSLRFKKLIQK